MKGSSGTGSSPVAWVLAGALAWVFAVALSERGFAEWAAAGDFNEAEAWARAAFVLVQWVPLLVLFLLVALFLARGGEQEP